MGRYRDHNGGDKQSWKLSGAMQTCLGSLFCLFLLLAVIFVPLAHQSHLHALEGLYPPIAAGADQKVGLRLSAPEPKETDQHHDAASCSICQAALCCRHFAIPTLSLSPVLSLPDQRSCHNTITSVVANPDALVLGSRAPPVSL
jgi:hypothetical protein